MKHPAATALVSFASVALLAAVLSSVSAPVSAVTSPSPSGVPISVVIPGSATPTPASTGGGGTGGGTGGGLGGGSGDNSGGGGSGGAGSTCSGTNPNGSPIPPAQPKENAAKLTVDKERLRASEWIITRASGYQPSEKAQIVLYPGTVVIGSYTVDAQGGFSARFRIPEGTRTGLHVLEVTGWESCSVTNAEITIVSAPLTSSWLTLWWVYVVLGLLFVGLLSLLIAFRREISSWFGGQGIRESTG